MPKTENKDSNEPNKDEEYGVVLKNKKLRRKIYPQKGKKPSKDEESYRIV